MVIVTGGAGFIGSNIVAALGDQAISLDRVASKKAATSIVCDLTNPASMQSVAKRLHGKHITHIVHLAAITPFSGDANPDYSFDLKMAESVVALCEELGVTTLLYMSGWVVYDPTAPVPITETAGLVPDTDYGKSKLAVEQYLTKRLAVAKVVAMRAASVYGPGQLSSGLIPNLVKNALETGEITINAKTTRRDYLFIRDLVGAVAGLTKQTFTEHLPINIGSGRSVSVQEVAEAVVAAFAEHGRRVQLAVADKLSESPAADNQLDISRAQQHDILTTPTTLSDGLKQYVTWRIQN